MYYNYQNKLNILTSKKTYGEEVDEEINRIQKEIRELNQPIIYGGEKGVIMKIEKNFEINCSLLRQNNYTDPEKLTVLKFYTAINLIKKQNENGKIERHTKRK